MYYRIFFPLQAPSAYESIQSTAGGVKHLLRSQRQQEKKCETENPSGSKRGKVELEMMRGKQKTGLTDNKYETKKNDKDTITKITATMGELADQEKEKHPTV